MRRGKTEKMRKTLKKNSAIVPELQRKKEGKISFGVIS
jgi:hypothetical protein